MTADERRLGNPCADSIQFVIAGAGKSGTSSLHAMLDSHPDVCMASIKEPRYFTEVQPGDLFPRSGTQSKGVDWYLGLFENRQCQKGDASTIYFTAPDSPGLLFDHNPSLKLIFLLRNPVDRFYSHYWQEIKTGSMQAPLGELLSNDHPRLQRYIENSSYKKHVSRYVECFGERQILVLIAEQFFDNLQAGMDRVFEFLELNSIDIDPGTSVNTAALPRSRTASKITRSLAARYAQSEFQIPAFLETPAKKILKKMLSINRKAAVYPFLDESLQSTLKEMFLEDQRYIESLLGEDILLWRQKPVAVSQSTK